MANRFKLNPIWWLMAAALFLTLNLAAKTLILPVEAITDSGTLSADDFSKKYPGIDISGSVPGEEGWYIQYTHGNLTYYFGPLDDYDEAIQKKLEMEEIRESVLYEAPELSDSTVEIFEYSYEMFSDANAPGAAGEEGSIPGQTAEEGTPGESILEGGVIGDQQGESGQKSGQLGQQEQSGFPQFPMGQSPQNSQQGGSPSNQQGQQGQQGSRSIFPPPSQSGGGGPSIPSQGGGGGGPPIPGGGGESGPPSPSQGGGGLPIWQLIRKIFWGR